MLPRKKGIPDAVILVTSDVSCLGLHCYSSMCHWKSAVALLDQKHHYLWPHHASVSPGGQTRQDW